MNIDRFIALKLKQVEKYCAAKRISISAFGEKVAGTTELINRLKGKGNMTVKTLRRIDQFIKEHK